MLDTVGKFQCHYDNNLLIQCHSQHCLDTFLCGNLQTDDKTHVNECRIKNS